MLLDDMQISTAHTRDFRSKIFLLSGRSRIFVFIRTPTARAAEKNSQFQSNR